MFAGVILLSFFTVNFCSAAQEDWSCDFDDDECNIAGSADDNGKWKREQDMLNSNWYYKACFFKIHAKNDEIICSLPQDVQFQQGQLLFKYYVKYGRLDTSVCETGERVLQLSDTNDKWSDTKIIIDCPGNIIVTFTAVDKAVWWTNVPDVRIDDISLVGSSSTTPVPSTSLTTTLPSTSFTTKLPSTSLTTKLPSTSLTTKLPSTSLTTKLPSTSLTTKLPSTSLTTKLASNSSPETTVALPHTIESNDSITEQYNTTTELTLPTTINAEEQKGGPDPVVTGVGVGFILLLIIAVTVAAFIFRRRRLKPVIRSSEPEPLEFLPPPTASTTDNTYVNPAFCSKDIKSPEPSQFRESADVACSNGTTSGVNTSNHSTINTNYSKPINSSFKVKVDNTNPQASPGLVAQQDLPEYYVLQPANENYDYSIRQTANSPRSIPEDDNYQHLHHDMKDVTKENGLDYGTTATLFDEDEYNTLSRGNEYRVANSAHGNHQHNDSGEDYQTLGLTDENDFRSPASHTDNIYNVLDDGGTVGKENSYDTLRVSRGIGGEAVDKRTPNVEQSYQALETGFGSNLMQNPAGKRGSNDDTEAEYHEYQDPNETGKRDNRPSQKESDRDPFYSDDYSILHDGKEIGDYHQYQCPDDVSVDGGVTKDPSQEDGDNYYSVVLAGQGQTNVDDLDQHEPIYSEDVYGELD